MADKKFEIRFDKHGCIIVEDAELLRRLKYLLDTNGQLVMRFKSAEPNIADLIDPRQFFCPDGFQPRLALCPNGMCVCGGLKVVEEAFFEQQWKDLGQGVDEH